MKSYNFDGSVRNCKSSLSEKVNKGNIENKQAFVEDDNAGSKGNIIKENKEYSHTSATNYVSNIGIPILLVMLFTPLVVFGLSYGLFWLFIRFL